MARPRLDAIAVSPLVELAATLSWSLAATGAYWRFRCWAWTAPAGVIPTDESQRANILGQPVEALHELWAEIANAYMPVEGGWVDPVLEAQRRRSRGSETRTDDRMIDASITTVIDDRSGVDHDRDRDVDHAGDQKVFGLDLLGDHLGDQKDDRRRSRRKSDQPAPAPQYTPAFLTFWEAYPRKVAKPAAWREWQRVASDGTVPALMAGLVAWVRSGQWQESIRTDPERRLIVHPRTFLSQRRWEDAPRTSIAPGSLADQARDLPGDLIELLDVIGAKRFDHALFTGASITRTGDQDAQLIIPDDDARALVITTYGQQLEAAAARRWQRRLRITQVAA